jgi:hypothetical protein
MRSSAVLAIVAASLVSQVSGTIYVTQPVATTTCTAGQQCTVAWNDDGNAPALASIGPCSIDLCTGGVQQQTCLQNISPSLDVSQNAQVTYTVNPSIGPDGNMYFIKFSSLAFKDPTNPQFAFTSFSAKYTLAGMTGQFNATVSAEIAGASVAPAGASAAPAASTPAATGGLVTTTKPAASAAATSAKPTTSAKATNGAFTTAVASLPGMALVAGLVMGAAAFF